MNSGKVYGERNTCISDFPVSNPVIIIQFPFIFREKLIRLQHENKMLKLQAGENQDEQGQLLQSMLDDANARKNELESENR